MKQTVLRVPKDPSRLSPYNMRRGSRSPTGFPDSSWGGEGQGSYAGVVTHINCLDFLFLSLSSSFFSLFLFFYYCLTHHIEQYFFGQVTVSLFPFFSFSFRLASLKWLIRYVVFCFGCWKRLISLCSVIILDLSRLCFLRRLWFACLLVGLPFFLNSMLHQQVFFRSSIF